MNHKKRIMKKNVFSLYLKVISFMLVLLGFSCEMEQADEYGTPVAKFRVKGKVYSTINGEKKSLNNIKLKLEGYSKQDSAYSKPDGTFDFSSQIVPDNNTFKFTISDIDGDENLGEFESKEMSVDFTNVRFENGSGNWDRGEATKDLGDIELTLKEED